MSLRQLYTYTVTALALLVMATGCQIQPVAPPSVSAPTTTTPAANTTPVAADSASLNPVQTVMAMHQDGQINDQQAARMLAALLSEEEPTTMMVAQTTQRPATTQMVAMEPVMQEVAPAPAAAETKPAIPGLTSYSRQTEVTGRMRSIGSDTMDKLMQLWEDGFKQYHPRVRMFHEGKGSSTAPPALSEGRADFGPMSREIKQKEIDSFKAKFGYEPSQFRVAIDSLAVYVHPSNPIAKRGLTLQELDAIYSSTRNRGAKADITTWGDLGLKGEWANAPIRVYSRNSASGTYGFFKDVVLAKGEYKTTNEELVGSEALVASVANDKYGIGYSGIGYKTDNVATPPLAKEPGGTYFEAKAENAYTGDYPLARFLYLTLNLAPDAATDLQREFMAFVLSSDGQQLVTLDGFYPISREIAKEELAKVGF